MPKRALNCLEHSFAHSVLVENPKRWLLISGQIPEDSSGVVPEGFVAQAHLVWDNIEAQLRAAGMSLDNLVKVTTFLSDRRYREPNFEVRHERLKHRNVAVTVIIADIYDPAWLLEIEAIAAA